MDEGYTPVTASIEPPPEEVSELARQFRSVNSARDVRELARTILAAPLRSGEVERFRPGMSIEETRSMNTDMLTRILINTAVDAAGGDKAARADIIKLAGYAPPREATVTLNLPTIVDDLTLPVKAPDKPVLPQEVEEDAQHVRRSSEALRGRGRGL